MLKFKKLDNEIEIDYDDYYNGGIKFTIINDNNKIEFRFKEKIEVEKIHEYLYDYLDSNFCYCKENNCKEKPCKGNCDCTKCYRDYCDYGIDD